MTAAWTLKAAAVLSVALTTLLVVGCFENASAFHLSPQLRRHHRIAAAHGHSATSTRLFYRNSTDIPYAAVPTTRNATDAASAYASSVTTTLGDDNNKEEDRRPNPYNHNIEQHRHNVFPDLTNALHSSFAPPPREIDRSNLHPIYKLGWIPEQVPLSVVAALALVVSPILLPLLPLLVALRKRRWDSLRAQSQHKYGAAFLETTLAYRRQQRILVNQLLQEEEQLQKQPPFSLVQNNALPKVIAVTMATGQEGQGVVRSLVESPRYQHVKILALVRNPDSNAAQALAQLSPTRVELVQCDSTNAESLRQALEPAEAVFLATTLNKANAGQWTMAWDGGAYEVSQGTAFAQACQELPNLKHVVYGTAPVRKWPEAFDVEPPIHYAAKWRIERILEEVGLPVTCLRKCPYHENFTKLTKVKTKKTKDSADDDSTNNLVVAMGVEAGGAFDTQRKVELERGHYRIKALTPPHFTYNMMDPRDTGKWAVLAFSHPSTLIGQSLSVASDAMTGLEMAQAATECGALGDGVTFSYEEQPRWLFEALAFVEPTFVYISGLQRWSSDGGQYDLDKDGVAHARKLMAGSTWADHLEREGLGQFTETMADLLPDFTK